MSFVHLREYKRYIIYTTVFIGLILLINVFAINYIKEEQKYQDVLKLSAYQKVIQALIINNIDLLQKSSINNQYDTNQQILLLKDYIKNQVFVPKSSSDLNGYDNHLGELKYFIEEFIFVTILFFFNIIDIFRLKRLSKILSVQNIVRFKPFKTVKNQ